MSQKIEKNEKLHRRKVGALAGVLGEWCCRLKHENMPVPMFTKVSLFDQMIGLLSGVDR
jgi:hypothetical protein